MKNFLVLMLLFVIARSGLSQNNSSDYNWRFYNIIEMLKQEDYYNAVKDMDSFIKDYPKDEAMYFNRGLAKYNLNEVNGAKEDFLKSKALGIKKRDAFINYFTSTDYLTKLLAKGYLSDYNLVAQNGYKPVFTARDSIRGALRPERTCFDVYFYDLTVKILPKSKSIEGSNLIYFKTVTNTKTIQIDLTENYNISSINFNGKELKYRRLYDALFIDFDEELNAGKNYMLSISYSGKPRIAPNPPWNCGFVWKRSRFKRWIGVACEHFGASTWWPCKDHLSDKPDSMRINVQIPNGYQAIANGNLRSVRKIDDKYSNFEWFVSYPINTYNATFYMGNFVNFSDTLINENGSYKIDYYVLPHNLKRAKKYYSQTKDILRAYEKLFGEYPFKRDGVAMVEAPYTGMEHQSAIAIGGEYGRTKRRDYDNTDYDYLVVHETAHEWWGNAIAVNDMAEAWINEGFATYAEHLFMEQRFGYNEYLSATASNMRWIFNIWPVIGIKDVNDNCFIGGDIYHKGAATLNNLRCCVNNDSIFFKIIKDFYNKNKYKIVTSRDFVELVNEYTGTDYTDFFKKFLYEKEPPVLKYHFTLQKDSLKFSYKWTNVDSGFSMPFSITLNGDTNIRLVATVKPQEFVASDVKSFFLPNEKRFKKGDKIAKNAFTYFWTEWSEEKEIKDEEKEN